MSNEYYQVILVKSSAPINLSVKPLSEDLHIEAYQSNKKCCLNVDGMGRRVCSLSECSSSDSNLCKGFFLMSKSNIPDHSDLVEREFNYSLTFKGYSRIKKKAQQYLIEKILSKNGQSTELSGRRRKPVRDDDNSEKDEKKEESHHDSSLVEDFCNYLGERMSLQLALECFYWSYENRLPLLKRNCYHVIRRYFSSFINSHEFASLDLQVVKEILFSIAPSVRPALSIFRAILIWIAADSPSRIDRFPELFRLVPVQRVPPIQLINTLGQHEMVRSNQSCLDILSQSRDYHLLHGIGRSKLIYPGRLKNSQPWVFGYIYIIADFLVDEVANYTKETNCGRRFNPWTGQWNVIKSTRSPRRSTGLAVLSNKLYAVGGFVNHQQTTKKVEVYDPETETWSYVSSLDSPVGFVSVVPYKLFLYAFAYNPKTNSVSIEMYNVRTNDWTVIETASPQCRLIGNMVEFGGLFYDCCNGMVYNPREMSWKFIPKMKHERIRSGITRFRDKIFVCGGRSGETVSNICEAYDPMTREWSTLGPLNIPRFNFSLVATYQNVYAFGEFIEVYDPTSNCWTILEGFLGEQSPYYDYYSAIFMPIK